MKHCVNCGALLNGKVCEYCGSDYSDDVSVYDEQTVKLRFGNEVINCYVAETIEQDITCGDSYRDMSGRLVRKIYPQKRIFKVIEY